MSCLASKGSEVSVFKVIMSPSGNEAWLPRGSSLTELALELTGSDRIPFGCRAGACGACVIEVLEGLSNLSNREEDHLTPINSLNWPSLTTVIGGAGTATRNSQLVAPGSSSSSSLRPLLDFYQGASEKIGRSRKRDSR
ncbi:2Fe-2S iron-sulfur cluster-binding protein [Variovorax sp. HW608]|uniref:2Fe-2S iron-sulfur cluster-binding protein n=1 Tax=Variovorax sp. HW608 TaxID=1034889 RepID=UPI001E5B6F1D|nr:2Fe-2S iron-sulfur cluster-binding protein [Variovorax sp. HW608]